MRPALSGRGPETTAQHALENGFIERGRFRAGGGGGGRAAATTTAGPDSGSFATTERGRTLALSSADLPLPLPPAMPLPPAGRPHARHTLRAAALPRSHPHHPRARGLAEPAGPRAPLGADASPRPRPPPGLAGKGGGRRPSGLGAPAREVGLSGEGHLPAAWLLGSKPARSGACPNPQRAAPARAGPRDAERRGPPRPAEELGRKAAGRRKQLRPREPGLKGSGSCADRAPRPRAPRHAPFLRRPRPLDSAASREDPRDRRPGSGSPGRAFWARPGEAQGALTPSQAWSPPRPMPRPLPRVLEPAGTFHAFRLILGGGRACAPVCACAAVRPLCARASRSRLPARRNPLGGLRLRVGWRPARALCSPRPRTDAPERARSGLRASAGRGRPAGMPRATCRSSGFLGLFPGAVGPGLRP